MSDMKTESDPPKKPGRPRREAKKCLTPGCDNMFCFGPGGDKSERGGRGLCKRCHVSASSLVRRKITTWEELEEAGLSEPKYGSLVELALRKVRAGKPVTKIEQQVVKCDNCGYDNKIMKEVVDVEQGQD